MAHEDTTNSPFPRFRVLRRLRSDHESGGGPLLVADRDSNETLRVLRAIDDRNSAAFASVLGLRHPHVAAILALERGADGRTYLVVEYVPGSDLREIRSTLVSERRRAVLCDVLRGLEALHHHGLAHGDLKPGNVIVRPDGRAVLVDPAFIDGSAAAFGTLQYLAPERLLSAPPSSAADLYAFGCVAFELLAGEPLRMESDPAAIVRATLAGGDRDRVEQKIDDPTVRDLVLRCLESDPSLRCSDARLALERLERDDSTAVGRDLAAEFAAAMPVLPRSSAERIDRLLSTSRRGECHALVISGAPGSGKSTHLERLREQARRRGFVAVELLRVTDWERAAAELESTGMPVLFVADDVVPSDAFAGALKQALDTIAPRRLAATFAFSGDPRDVLLAIPRNAGVTCDEMVVPPLSESEIETLLRSVLPNLGDAETVAMAIHARTHGVANAVRHLLVEFARAQGFAELAAVSVADLGRLEGIEPSLVGPSLVPENDVERALFALLALVDGPIEIDLLAHALGVPGIAILAPLAAAARRGFVTEFAPPLRCGPVAAPFAARARSEGGALSSELERTAALAFARSLLEHETHWLAAARSFQAAGRRIAARIALKVAGRAMVDHDATVALEALGIARRSRLPRGCDAEALWIEAKANAILGRYSRADDVYRALAVRVPELPTRVVIEHAQLLERASRSEEALDRLEAANGRARGSNVVALRSARAWMLEACGKRGAARAECDSLWSLRSGFSDPEVRLEVAAVSAAIYDRNGDRRLARFAAIEARRYSRQCGRATRAAHFDSTLAMFDAEAGELERAARRLERAASALERAKDRRLLPDTLTRIGMLELQRDQPQRAMAAFQRATILFGRAENRRGLGWAQSGEGAARLRVGDPEGAIRCLEMSIEHRLAVHASSGAVLSCCELVRARAALGDVPGARTAVKRALRMMHPMPDSALAAVLLVVAEIARDREQGALLRGCSRRLLEARFESLPIVERSRIALFAAEVEIGRGEVRSAIARVRRVRHATRSIAERSVLAQANAVRAACAVSLGKARAARIAFEHAVELASEPSRRAGVCLTFVRAVKRSLEKGQVTLVADGHSAAREAMRLGSRLGDRQRASLAREAMSIFAAAQVSRQVEGDLLRENRQLRQVIEATRWINEADALPEVLGRIIDAALELTGAARGFVVTSTGGVLRFEAARNLRQQDIEKPEMQLSRSIIERSISGAETIVTSEARTDQRFRDFASISQLALLSVMCSPLKSRRGVSGAIYVDDPERIDRFDDSARRVIEALAEHAAIALEKAELREQIVALNAHLERSVTQRTREIETVRDDLEKARRELDRKRGIRAIVTQDPRMLELLSVIERAADSDAPALILGEAGTGKDLIARALHESSYRRRHRFIALNCASLPDTLIEAELFGYKKGAFTGAMKDREGLIAAADRGTLFLDEIAELPLAAQAKLLRVLQNGEYTPLGASDSRRAQFRIVAATNRPLKQWVDSGRFREDLYWRLRVLQLDVPALRERASDIPLLVRHFAIHAAMEIGSTPLHFDDAALAALSRAPFPGNVRELEALVRALRVTSRGDRVELEDLPREYRVEPPRVVTSKVPPEVVSAQLGSASLMDLLASTERQLVVEALSRSSGDRNVAAQALGISLRWLQKLVKKHAIDSE